MNMLVSQSYYVQCSVLSIAVINLSDNHKHYSQKFNSPNLQTLTKASEIDKNSLNKLKYENNISIKHFENLLHIQNLAFLQ